MFVDYVLNGQAHGDVGEQLAGCRYEPGLLRPYIDRDGKRYVTVNAGANKDGTPRYVKRALRDIIDNGVGMPGVYNAMSLRKDEWKQMDAAVLKEARARLRAWSDLLAANSFGGFNAMSKTFLEHETMSDPGEAIVDMDALTPGRRDRPLFQAEGLPLPIVHSSYGFSQRDLAVSRNSNTPLDMTMAEAAGRRVAETIERMVIGNSTAFAYGNATTNGYSRAPKVYGYITHPARLTKTDLTTPTGSNPASTVADVLAMRDQLYAINFFGPFMLYHSNDWDQYLDNDYYVSSGTPSQTLRQRLRAIEGIQDIRRLDFLTSTANPFTMIMVQMTSDVARAIDGMGITTVQWEEKGGLEINFKVMAIQVPQIRATYGGYTGILQATTS